MSLPSVIFLLNVIVAALGATEYNYDRCDVAAGPLFWGILSSDSQCGTVLSYQSEGTPINLCGAVAFPSGTPTFAVSGYDTTRTMNASNTGHSIYLYVNDNRPTLQLGSIANIVGRTTNTSTYTWALQQIHPHWGRSGLVNEGSEHYMQGVAYPMEVHLVHYNTKYGTFSAAVSSGQKDALLVVGVFLTVGSTDLNIMTAWANSIPSLTQTARPLSTQVNVSDFFNGVGEFYSYRGSLTTPGCNEIVTWVVMKDTKSITLDFEQVQECHHRPSCVRKEVFNNGNSNHLCDLWQLPSHSAIEEPHHLFFQWGNCCLRLLH